MEWDDLRGGHLTAYHLGCTEAHPTGKLSRGLVHWKGGYTSSPGASRLFQRFHKHHINGSNELLEEWQRHDLN